MFNDLHWVMAGRFERQSAATALPPSVIAYIHAYMHGPAAPVQRHSQTCSPPLLLRFPGSPTLRTTGRPPSTSISRATSPLCQG